MEAGSHNGFFEGEVLTGKGSMIRMLNRRMRVSLVAQELLAIAV